MTSTEKRESASTLPESREPQTRQLDALVIGAGFAGLYQLLCLRDRLGIDVHVLEAGGGVGGTWYWNRYPGARCDTESHSYSYSFSESLTQEWEWTERYPEQPEILRYLNHVADKFDLKRSIQFNTRVTSAHYDAPSNRWDVGTEIGERFSVRYLITAVGCLSTANVPDISGLDEFAGEWYHTGEWPHEGVDFAGQRVGLIGTGSTGIQAAPVIATKAKYLTVFQRTPNYSVPARNIPLSEDFKRHVKDTASEIRDAMHASTHGHPWFNSDRSALATPPDEREAIYEAAWERGGIRFRAAFEDLMSSRAANDTAADFIRRKILGIVKDPATAAMLTNFDHPYAGKRPPIDTDYYETFNRDNVTLVDVKAAPIEAITASGVRTSDAEFPLDVLVFATGFDALTGPLLNMDIRGREGRQLSTDWAGGPRSYLGLQVAGYPNLFTITGPGSPSVLTNMPVAIEQHAEWITDCIAHMNDSGVERMEPTPDAMDKWGQQVNEAADATLLSVTASSWYLGANVPGKPRVFMPYAGGLARYREICNESARRDYDDFEMTS
jgi:cation diffusion facilitator CzcD-associated flavoprotein CzcO